jgi:hypothetical protein
MSHRNNGNHFLLILLLCLLFPEAAIAFGIFYLIYIYFVPIFIVSVIIFIFYALSRKQIVKVVEKKPEIVLPKQTLLPASKKELPIHTVYSNSSSNEFKHRDYNVGYEEDEDVRELMENHDLDKDTAEHVQEIMDDLGIDEDDAVELADEF